MTTSLDGITGTEYMEFCEPISAYCVKDGIPMAGFYRGADLKGFGCGHCGLSLDVHNKRHWDLPRYHT